MQPDDFCRQYETALASQSWENIALLVHPSVSVTFSDGSVHEGLPAVKVAFERNFRLIKNERFSIKNVRWLQKGDETAVYLFSFFWEGVFDGQAISGSGVGTSVLVKRGSRWLLLAEHLGKKQV